MLESDRISDSFGRIDLGFVEREATPKSAMTLSIRLYAAGLLLSCTVTVLDVFGVDRHQTTVHNWVQKAALQPTDGKAPNPVTVDETTIQLNG